MGKSNKNVFGIVVVIILILVLVGLWQWRQVEAPNINEPVACTADARMCPDGSYVGRTGPMCEFAQCPTASTTTTSGDVTLGVGETGMIGEMSVTFNKFIQDSRCAVDVVCIQAGAVNINVTFKHHEHVETKNMPSDEVPQVFHGYAISIVGVSPAAHSQVQILPNDYKITFHIEEVKAQ